MKMADEGTLRRPADKVAAIVAEWAKGTGIRRIAREFGVGVGTVLRLTGEFAYTAWHI
jgi:transposase